MVGTFNIEKDKLLEKQHNNWPNSPSYQGGNNPILTTGKETEGMTEEEFKEFEKKKSKLIHNVCTSAILDFQDWSS